jgi:hypothetical protein
MVQFAARRVVEVFMKALLFVLALFIGQAMTLQDKPVVHLKPHSDLIEAAFGGSRLELSRGPEVVHLPAPPPKPDENGVQWTLDVRNFGPLPVTVEYRDSFSVSIAVNQTIHIHSNGNVYFLQH